jgi:SAM-dependent methyltransferase
MTLPRKTEPFAHDDLASYDTDLNRGLSLSGETKDFFAHGRLAWLARRLASVGGPSPNVILDYGCGGGDTTGLLAQRWPHARVVGVDTSASLIAAAARGPFAGHCDFYRLAETPADLRFDLVYCNGVFHHIPVLDRAAALAWIRTRLMNGGRFALWENNAWNPGTRWVMRRIPFDRDAVMLSPRGAWRMLTRAGFAVQSLDFAFVFPKCLSWARPLERAVCKLPLGAQFQVLCGRD